MKTIKVFRRFRNLFLNVLAEEESDLTTKDGTPDEKVPEVKSEVKDPDPTPSGNVNYEDLISAARKEERTKLYGTIDKLKKEKNDLLLVVGDRDSSIKTLTSDLEKSDAELAETSKSLKEGTSTNKTIQEMSLTISKLEKQLEDNQSAYDTDIQGIKISSYMEKKIAEASKDGLVEELVGGTTEEEIDESVAKAKQRYADIREKALSNVVMPKASNPATSHMNSFKDKSVQEISSMTPADYAEYRKNLGIK